MVVQGAKYGVIGIAGLFGGGLIGLGMICYCTMLVGVGVIDAVRDSRIAQAVAFFPA